MELEVFIFGNKVGKLYETKNRIYFRYDKEFLLKNIEISPFKLPLSLGTKLYTNTNYSEYYNYLPGVFFDSLPFHFGMNAIKKYCIYKGINPEKLTILQKLAFIGKNGMGALEYIPEIIEENNSDEILNIEDLYAQAKNIIKNDFTKPSKNLINNISLFTCADGTRPKVLVSWNRKENIIKKPGCKQKGFEEWIIKFDKNAEIKKSNEGVLLEYLYMSMAKEVGINVPDISLIYTNNGLIHYAIKRFDRKNGKKLHLHTLAAMNHLNSNIQTHYSYLKTFKLTSHLTNNFSDIKELFKRMIFNAIGRNQDDHAKNFSFLMDENGRWTLAPAYDIACSFGKGYAKEHRLTINGKTDNIELKDLYEVAKKINISQSEVNNIVEEIGDKFLEFEKRAKELGFSRVFIKKIINKKIRWNIPQSLPKKIFPNQIYCYSKIYQKI